MPPIRSDARFIHRGPRRHFAPTTTRTAGRLALRLGCDWVQCERFEAWAPTRPITKPMSGLFTRHAQREGGWRAQVSGGERLVPFFPFPPSMFPFVCSSSSSRAVICLTAVASRSSGAQQQRDLDPPTDHAMGQPNERPWMDLAPANMP